MKSLVVLVVIAGLFMLGLAGCAMTPHSSSDEAKTEQCHTSQCYTQKSARQMDKAMTRASQYKPTFTPPSGHGQVCQSFDIGNYRFLGVYNYDPESGKWDSQYVSLGLLRFLNGKTATPRSTLPTCSHPDTK